MKDFLLGDINEINASKFIRALTGGREGYALSQLDRIFKIKPVLEIQVGCSHPDFEEFLQAVGFANIQKVEIVTHPYDIEVVGDVYGVNLFFENGIIRYLPHWTAYKEIRAEEIITTMLKPLKLAGLGNYISIANDPYPSQKTDFFASVDSCVGYLKQLLSITNYREQYNDAWYRRQAEYLISD